MIRSTRAKSVESREPPPDIPPPDVGTDAPQQVTPDDEPPIGEPGSASADEPRPSRLNPEDLPWPPPDTSIEITPVTDAAQTPQFKAATTVTAFRHANPRRRLEFPWPELRWPYLDDRCVAFKVTIDTTGEASAFVIDDGGVPPHFVERARLNTVGKWHPAISSDGAPVADVMNVLYCWSRGRR